MNGLTGNLPFAPRRADADADNRYAPLASRLRNTDRIRGMVGAAVQATPPTISFSATATLTKTFSLGTPYPTILRSSGAGRYIDGNGSRWPKDRTRLDGLVGQFAGSVREEFDLDDSAFEFFTAITAGGFTIWVNEQPHAAAPQLWTTLATNGTGGFVKVDFGSRAYRRIVIEYTGGNKFNRIDINPTGGIFPPSISSPRFAWIGDSYGYGGGATTYSNGVSVMTGRLLGFADVWNVGSVSSTGILQAASSTDGPYNTRLVGDVIPFAPDLIVYQGSINDGNSWPGNQNKIATQVQADVATLRAALPKAAIVVTSILYPGTPSATYTAINGILSSAAAAAGVPFLDVFTPQFFYGTGKQGATNGTGNSDVYLFSDGTHPTDAGHLALARVLASRIAGALGLNS